jgi:phage terminase small subunit
MGYPGRMNAVQKQEPYIVADRSTVEAILAKLRPKQRQFIVEYLKDFNQQRAMRDAGVPVRDRGQWSWALLRQPEIKALVQFEIDSRAKRTLVTADMVVEQLKKIAFADIRKALWWGTREKRELLKGGSTKRADGTVFPHREVVSLENFVGVFASDEIDEDTAAAISEIKQGKDGSISIKFHDMTKALELLGRHIGMWGNEKLDVNVSGTVDLNAKVESASDRELALAVIAQLYAGANAEVVNGKVIGGATNDGSPAGERDVLQDEGRGPQGPDTAHGVALRPARP